MKKGILFAGFIFILILVSGVLSMDYKECSKDCIKDTQAKTNECNSKLIICSENSNTHLNSCSSLNSKNKTQCLKDARNELTKCKNDKKACLKDIDNSISKCKKKCLYIGKNITCEKGKYNAGDVFLKDCNKCECNFNGKTSCKTTEYCNFNDLSISKEKCEASSGLYQKLCAGSIMSTKCTIGTYCQCGGKLNLTCPGDYTCLYDFYLNKHRSGQFAQEWVRLAEYKKMGNIGICVKKPVISSCGNGICESTCKEDNCALSETKYNCPEDC